MGKTCRCGCGEPVRGLRRTKQYVDDAHRRRHGRQRAAEQEADAPAVVTPAPEQDIPLGPAWWDDDAPGWTAWSGRDRFDGT
jgi:hypothetical protein